MASRRSQPRRAAKAPTAGEGAPRGLPKILPALLLLIAGVAAYGNGLAGALVFDDKITILHQPLIRSIFPLSRFWTDSSRPIADLTFALNDAIGRFDPRGYHLVNLLIHLAAGLLLYGVVRRTLLGRRWGGRFEASATSLSLAVALIWLVHPLQTQSVTYVTQRCESLMGLLYLLVLYAAIRAESSVRPLAWFGVAIVACAAGMGTKAVMVSAPLAVAIYDWLFLMGTAREILARRWPLYLGLAGSWLVLAGLGILAGVMDTPQRGAITVGFGYKGVSPWEYARTQPSVLVHYLRLCLWPRGQCLDYGWPVARGAREIVLPAALIVGLIGATIRQTVRRQPVGFLGAWFFLILAPTSSFIPIKDLAFEHRMYLPSAAVVAAGVLGGWVGLHRLTVRFASWRGRASSLEPARITCGAAVSAVQAPSGRLCHTGYADGVLGSGMIGVIAIALCTATIRRNALYADPVALWRDTAAKAPWNPRAANSLGSALLDRGEVSAAMEAFQSALQIDPSFGAAHANLGSALGRAGRLAEAVEHYRWALAIDPAEFGGEVRFFLGAVLLQMHRAPDAIKELRLAIRRLPNHAMAHAVLGHALRATGAPREAAEEYHRALSLDPGLLEARQGLDSIEAGRSRHSG